MAIVYILTNESMPDTIKVGITENLDRDGGLEFKNNLKA